MKNDNQNDLYDILGISKNSSDNDIKKAFRKLSVKWHPDKHRPDTKEHEEAKRLFPEITNAYQILSDPKKRQIYDQFGIDGLKREEQQRHNPFFQNIKRQMLPSIEHTIHVNLKDLYMGKILTFDLNIRKPCHKCKGQGSEDITKITKCNTCRGNGKIVVNIPLAPGLPIMTQQHIICKDCNGKGKTCDKDFLCSDCKGSSFIQFKDNITYVIKPGDNYGSYLIEEQGDYFSLSERGNIKLNILPLKDYKEKYERRGYDLYHKTKITLREALLGFDFKISHLDANNPYIRIVSKNIINPNDTKLIPNKGMPIDNNTFGNLILIFDIEFPKQLTEEQHNILSNGFPETYRKNNPSAQLPIIVNIDHLDNINDNLNSDDDTNEPNCVQM